jgi:hypothetical protein
VILGSHARRADVLLEAPDVRPEHLRVYITRAAPPAAPAPDSAAGEPRALLEVRPLQGAAVLVDGRALEDLEWLRLGGGEEVQLGAWRFRLEPT